MSDVRGVAAGRGSSQAAAEPILGSSAQPEDVLLLVEVADTSYRDDREVKVPPSARAGIPEAWIVDLNHNG